MTSTRLNSLSPLNLKDWLWQPIFNDMLDLLSIFKLKHYPIPVEFLYKRVVTGSSRKPIEITTSTWASQFSKVKQIRAACIQGSGSLSVLNLVIIPLKDYKKLSPKKIKELHISYDTYNAEVDPAHALFKSYFGKQWADDFVREFLFPACNNPI